MFSKSVVLAVGAVGAALFMGTSAKAVTLDTLTGANFGGQIISGNMIYSNFEYGGTTPSSSVVVNSTSTGLEFSTNTGGWSTPSGSSIISYDVTVIGAPVQTVNLGFTATATGNAIASVGETVTDLTNNKDYSLQVSAVGTTNVAPSIATTGNTASDSVTLDPTTNSLHIVKSIDVASDGTGSATITLVDNAYIQIGGTAPPVPEPMTLALLPLAIAGLGLRKKFAR